MDRAQRLAELSDLLARHRAVAVLGARQVGKTTLAKQLAAATPGPVAFFDLENSEDLARLADPMLALKDLRGLVVLDEVQRRPDIFPTLRVLLDRPRGARFLILGSASPELLRQSSESLAGRIAYQHVEGFDLEEVGAGALDKLWLRGGFPRAFLARSGAAAAEWRRFFIDTFLERDLPQLGLTVAAPTLRRFWTMIAHYHGQTWNSAEFARSFGVSDHTARRYLDLLSGTFVVRQLQPWHENLAKRQVKAPKVYVSDSGLLHTLLGIESLRDLQGHPKLGASWEGFLTQQVIRHLGARSDEAFYWATHAGADLDLLIVRGKERRGFEFKRTSSPGVTPSMRTALADLGLSSLDVVHAGPETFALSPSIRAVAADRVLQDLRPLGRKPSRA